MTLVHKDRADEAVAWRISDGPVPYPEALAEMEAKAAAIRAGDAREEVWLLEHPPLYTAGTSAKPEDLLEARFPVYDAGRGGEYTYHGPGQRVAYAMLDLQRRPRGPISRWKTLNCMRNCAPMCAILRNGSSRRWPAST